MNMILSTDFLRQSNNRSIFQCWGSRENSWRRIT